MYYHTIHRQKNIYLTKIKLTIAKEGPRKMILQ